MTTKKNKTISKFHLFTTRNLLLLGWTICAFGIGYGLKSNTPSAPMQMPAGGIREALVITGQPTQKDIRPSKNFIAMVEAVNEVNLKPQVSGTVDAVLFANGAFVKEGDELFIIDKSKYEANVQSAEAGLAKTQANVIQIQNDYNRQKKLYKDKFLPKAELEIVESNLEQAKAQVRLAEATLKLAQIDLEHATIKAPISGFISKAFVTKGNYVSTDSTALAKIVQIHPVRIGFSVTDKERLEKVMTMQPDETPFYMTLVLANGVEKPIQPENIFTDKEADKNTATISVYTEYANEDNLLLPGNVLTVKLSDTAEKPALLVPQDAVLHDSDGQYVMKVTPDKTALQQYIQTMGNLDKFYIVEKGLTKEDIIILSGAQKVRSGQKIKSVAPVTSLLPTTDKTVKSKTDPSQTELSQNTDSTSTEQE